MLSSEQNLLVTRTGPGTPCGELMRRCWQPAALVEELPDNRPLRALRLLGEDLVLFRDEQGRYGLIDRRCPHRGTDLSFGRLEDGGLRCPLHGWLMDTGGNCLEQPAEPPGSTFHEKVRTTAYPCAERNGIVFAYLGPGEPPALPALDCFAAPEPYTFAFKGFIDCNWLQALEVGIDPSHASFLHRFFEDEDPAEGYGQQFRARTSDPDTPVTKIMRDFACPRIEVEHTDYGLRIFALRELDEARTHVRVTNLLFPHGIVIPLSDDMTLTQWHVPVDDRSCWWYAIFFAFREPVDKALMRAQRLELYELPDYMPRKNRANNYGYDPEEQRTQTYTGMGRDINVHDQWAVESMGVLQDRSIEHLGASDKAIIANRRLLIEAIAELGRGAVPSLVAGTGGTGEIRGPAAIDTMAPAEDWQGAWKAHDLSRREQSDWALSPW
ncbi:MAG: aromatic ring-hydroxylating dioxygenase subunit alpha [Alphaproteobacteria bacterium]